MRPGECDPVSYAVATPLQSELKPVVRHGTAGLESVVRSTGNASSGQSGAERYGCTMGCAVYAAQNATQVLFANLNFIHGHPM